MTRICFIGTSLFQQGDAGSSVRMAHSVKSPIRWAQRLSGWRVDSPVWHAPYWVEGWEPSSTPGALRYFWGLNCGVSGQDVDEVVARIPQIAKIPADEFHIGGVTNSISAANYTAQELLDKILSACRTLRAITGAKIKIYTVLARDTTQWEDPSTQRTLAIEYNKLLKEQEEFEVYDWNLGWLDYTADVDSPIASYTPDGTHYSGIGAYFNGKRIAEDWIQEYPPAPPIFSSPSQCLNTGGFLKGAGGTASTGTTGTVPDGMRVERYSGAATIVASIDTDTSVKGSVQNLVLTPSGVAESSEVHFRTEIANTTHTLAGKWVQGTVKFRVNSANDSLDAVTLTVDDQSATGVEANDLYSVDDGFPQVATDGFIELRTPPLKLRDDSTSFRIRVEIFVNGEGTGDVDIDFAEFATVEVPDPEYKYGTVCPNSRVVSEGYSLSTPSGYISAGDPVDQLDLGGNGDSILGLQEAGILVEA